MSTILGMPFGSGELMHLTGATRMQVAYWVQTGLIEPSLGHQGSGKGSRFLWSFGNVLAVRALVRLRREQGIPLQQLRRLVTRLQHWDLGGATALTSPRLIVIGRQAYWAYTDDQMVQILGKTPGQYALARILIVDTGHLLRDVTGRCKQYQLHKVEEAMRESSVWLEKTA